MPILPKTNLDECSTALCALADAIDAKKDAMTQLLTKEQGKPLTQKSLEVDIAAANARLTPKLEIHENAIEETEYRRIVQRYTPKSEKTTVE